MGTRMQQGARSTVQSAQGAGYSGSKKAGCSTCSKAQWAKLEWILVSFLSKKRPWSSVADSVSTRAEWRIISHSHSFRPGGGNLGRPTAPSLPDRARYWCSQRQTHFSLANPRTWRKPGRRALRLGGPRPGNRKGRVRPLRSILSPPQDPSDLPCGDSE